MAINGTGPTAVYSLEIGIPSRGVIEKGEREDGKIVTLRRPQKVSLEWALTMTAQEWPMAYNRAWNVVVGRSIDEARTVIAKNAIERKARYLWFVDNDTMPPLNACKRLIYSLSGVDLYRDLNDDMVEVDEDKVMVACGIYPSKEEEPAPLIFRGDGTGPYWRWKTGEIFEITSGGTGCMLINTEVFKHIDEPWFVTADGKTDDVYFCQKVREAGFKIIADGNVVCSHFDYSTDPPQLYQFRPNTYPFREKYHANHGEPVGLSAAEG